jgi:pyruvate/2-oxoglutarate/acetoin dehydrogenase E1 component
VTRKLSYVEAVREATEQEMDRDASVIVLGMGVDDFRGINGTTRGLVEKFGPDRVLDTPLSEDAMTGVAIGAAMAGLRPIHVHIRMDFVLLAMNQLVNIAAKARYMYGGSVAVPLVVRSIIGRSWGQGPQHSQGLHAMLMHVPGLKVVAPSTPYDAKGCLVQAIRDPNPVMFIEHRMVHPQRGVVPEEGYTVPFGQARVFASGRDVTLVGISHMAVECLRARSLLEQVGIEAEVLDPVSLRPLDVSALAASVRKTGRMVVADTGWAFCGAGAEIVTATLERIGGERPIAFSRLGFAPTPCPTTKPLENLYYPDARAIALAAHALVRGKNANWEPRISEAPEVVEFKGPF